MNRRVIMIVHKEGYMAVLIKRCSIDSQLLKGQQFLD